jgi:hypothetical protein
MIRALSIAGLIPAAAGNLELANIASLLVALGTLIAGVLAFVRLRVDRPKIVEEVAGLAESRIREELRTAWQAVDRLRQREIDLEGRVDELERERDTQVTRILELERERDAQATRILELELLVREAGLGPLGA